MQTLAELSGTLATWTKFVFFHVLPIAVAQIYDWLRDWQLLVVAVLILAVFHVWSRGVLRAARRAARETVLSEAKSFDASLRLMRRQIEQLQDSFSTQQPAVMPAAAPPVEVSHSPPPELPVPEARTAQPQADRTIDGLRQAIRHALGAIPLTDDPLTEDGARHYSNVITYLNDGTVPEAGEGSPLARLHHELAELERATPPATCRQAWQSLVSINVMARDLAKSDGDASGSQGLLTMSGRATG